MAGAVDPLLDGDGISRLRTALAGYTPDGVAAVLGRDGAAALARGDLDGVRRAAGTDPVALLVRLFVLGDPLPSGQAARALAPLPLTAAADAGLLTVSGTTARARLDLRPYGPWWVLSDPGADVRPGRLRPDHVLGVGAASVSLAESAVRAPVTRALDLGTGCGVQALHLSQHAASVVATDVSPRALRLAATAAALAGRSWDLRAGSLLEPVAGEQFDLIVSNPPFVISPGGPASFAYRDSGLPGDAVLRRLLDGLPAHLRPGGTAQLLANWIVPPDGGWPERLAGWLAGSGCDAWIWQRELVDPGRYATLWLDDANEPAGPQRTARYDAWTSWLAAQGVEAIGMGLVNLRRTDSAQPRIVAEDVPQAVQRPVGAEIEGWFRRAAWLRERADLTGAFLHAAPDVVLRTEAARTADGWAPTGARLERTGGMRWSVETDDTVAAVVAACDGHVPLGLVLDLVAAGRGLDGGAVRAGMRPVIADLVQRGLLLPDEPPPDELRPDRPRPDRLPPGGLPHPLMPDPLDTP